MADQEDKRGKTGERRANDRRIASDAAYAGPDRRKGDRRLHERRST
jgi:hypothetical protein